MILNASIIYQENQNRVRLSTSLVANEPIEDSTGKEFEIILKAHEALKGMIEQFNHTLEQQKDSPDKTD